MSMIAGESSPKILGDAQVVVVNVEFGRGASEIQGTRDIVVALCDEIDKIDTFFSAQSAAIALPAGSIASLQANFAAITPPTRTLLKLVSEL